jgi:hypothetical protein
MKKLFLSFDFLGTKPTFFINGNPSIKTSFGACISILASIVILVCSSYYIYMLFSRTSYNIIKGEDYFKNPLKNWSNPEFSLMLLDKLMNDIPEKERIYGITGQYWCNKPKLQSDGSYKQEIEILPIELEKCSINKNFINDTDLWRDQKLINDSYCIVPGQNISSYKLFGENDYCGLVFWIHKCKNTTINQNCQSDDYITRTLQNTFVFTRFRDYYFDHDLLVDNGKPYVYSDLQQASISAYKRSWYLFRNVDYQTDDGFFLSEYKTSEYTNLATIREATDLRTTPTVEGSFMVVSLNMFQLKQKIIKKYYKAQDMISDLGGILKGVLLLSNLLSFYFTEKSYYNELINSNIHSFEDDEFFHEKNFNEKLYHKDSSKFHFNNFNSNSFIGRNPNINKNMNKILIRSSISKSSSHNIKFHQKFSIEKNSINTKKLHQENKFDNIKNCSLSKFEERRFKLYLKEKLFPVCCFKNNSSSRRKMMIFDKLIKIIQKQLDLDTILKHENIIDKLSYIFVSDRYKILLENCLNPYIKNIENINEDAKVSVFEFWEQNFKNLLNLNFMK